jgi:uncharacterized protein YndB with AHSA1/START domain
MNSEKFVYVTYIAATPEKVWAALIEPEFTRQYWRHENVSDWKPGSKWAHTRSDGETGKVDIFGMVVEVTPPHRLVMTWARPSEPEETARYSRVTFELGTVGANVRLVVTHDELDVDMARSISTGWPLVLSNLKSLLETGRPMTHLW